MLRFTLSAAFIKRFKLFILIVASLALFGLALSGVFIATRDLAKLERQVLTRIENEAGARITIGKSRHVYWPLPRVVMEDVRLDVPNLHLNFNAPRMVIGLSLPDLLDGQIESASLGLQDADIHIHSGALDSYIQSPQAIEKLLSAGTMLFENRHDLERLRITLSNTRITFIGAHAGTDHLVINGVDARFRYSQKTGQIDFFARKQSEIRPVELSFSLPTRALLIQDPGAKLAFAASGYGSRLSINGKMQAKPDLSFTGDINGVFHPALPLALEMVQGAMRFEGADVTNFSSSLLFDKRGISFEALRIAQSGKSLSGIASLRENAGRWSLSSTLAGDMVDGSAAQSTLSRLRESDGSWSSKPLDINPASRLDLDLRISTKAFRLGGVDLQDVALSVFTRVDRAEFAIAEGGFGQGTIKARVTLLQRPHGNDIRLLVSGEKLDANQFLDRAFGFSRLSGKGSFILQAESNGTSVADYMKNLSGSAAFDIHNGEIVGIDLERLAARAAVQPPQAALYAASGGKTPFELLSTNFTILNGKVEPSGSRFVSANVESQLEGMVDLPHARHDLAIILKRRRAIAGVESDFFAVRMEGALFSPILRPDLSLLVNR